MGTNYYAKMNGEEIHIGKSSSGWTFTFHTIKSIKSYKQWVTFLENKGVEIYNEYDEKVSLKHFMEMVEREKNQKNNHAKQSFDESYLDPEGHSMTPREFS